MLEEAADLKSKSDQLLHKAMAMMLEQSTKTAGKADRIIDTLVSPKMGEIMSVEDVTKILNVSKATLYNWIRSGKIPHKKPANGRVFFYKHHLTEFLSK